MGRPPEWPLLATRRVFTIAAMQPTAQVVSLQRVPTPPAPAVKPTAANSDTPCVWWWCDSSGRLADRMTALAAEGLTLSTRPLAWAESPPDATLGEPKGPAADAHVLCLGGNLASRLGLVRALRAAWPTTALLVLLDAPQLRDIDQVLALEMGADEVLSVQTSACVVAAHLRALWRRADRSSAVAQPPQDLHFGALSLFWRERRAQLGLASVPLTEGEFEVLWMLASQAGKVVHRRDLLRHLRGLDDDGPDRSIDSRVYRIRAKLGSGEAATRLRTVRHQGYVFSPAPW